MLLLRKQVLGRQFAGRLPRLPGRNFFCILNLRSQMSNAEGWWVAFAWLAGSSDLSDLSDLSDRSDGAERRPARLAESPGSPCGCWNSASPAAKKPLNG
jgi:hypothetical protein